MDRTIKLHQTRQLEVYRSNKHMKVKLLNAVLCVSILFLSWSCQTNALLSGEWTVTSF